MNITLHKTSTKLAALYLAIMMAISLFFSVIVYRLSVQEFNRVRGEQGLVVRGIDMPSEVGVGAGKLSALRDEFIERQDAVYEEVKNRVLTNLVVTNVIILVGGGVASYYLARRTLQPIEEAHEAQNRFTADASHELRTPIAAMRSETEVTLMNPKLTLAEAKTQMQSNLEELDKLTALSEGLLRLARFEHADLPKKPFELRQVVQDAIDRVMPVAEAKNILITGEIPNGLRGMGDKASLTEAVVILLDNAIKYSPEKSEISLAAASNQRAISLSVKDQGPGIKATELPHIFERFYRADTARSKQHVQGYGLGLAIAKNIVDIHDGLLTAKSTVGKGSTFTVTLPKA
jgi:two-component system sensor histidine kinase CiaH